MKKQLWIYFFGLVLAFSACSSKESSNKTVHENYIPVLTYTVKYDKMLAQREYIGIVEEDLSASMSFPIIGNIDKIYVSEGQSVKKGELIAELNSYSLTKAHAAASASLSQAEDAMERLQSLYDKKSLPEIKYIEMQTNLEKARSAEAIARKNLEDSRLFAPFSGVIGRKNVEAGENILPNQPVVILMKINKVNIKVAVPEGEINTIDLGKSATVRVSAASDNYIQGTISKKGISANPISHTYNIWLVADNSDNLLLPGMVCNVFVNSSVGENAIIIPNHCILKDGNGDTFVWKVDNGFAKKQIVAIGKQKTEGVEIIKGVSVGDEIISKGYQKVSNGQKIKPL